jgi:Uncharacterized protein conserved in bacteria
MDMRVEDKKSPALVDTDKMPWGRHKGKRMMDIPPAYLRWLYYDIQQNGITERNDVVYNYIYNSKDALAEELGEEL